ncbi:DUF4362 domain-containing protein [Rossellomorea yichunensis]|uniref:DUF4362 domain-containing protein n=1 Tax=Rossellomorea yichunensis TaxID=3077331 RepID=UPI0028DF3B21|nr:DUF4362 domain-containing protein [Rossellomorea sp. YC4-1]MDT9025874.1 DUF4362 domain-containing protein [Rossellomorea sp. YC4-1]
MRKSIMAGLFLLFCVGGCEEPEDQMETEVGKQVGAYKLVETDVVNTHGNIENMERFEEFYKNVGDDVEDRIRIVTYTEEGDPVLHDLDYDGNVLHSVRDSRRDTFGSGEIVEMSCENIEYIQKRKMADNIYKLADCDRKDADENVIWY